MGGRVKNDKTHVQRESEHAFYVVLRYDLESDTFALTTPHPPKLPAIEPDKLVLVLFRLISPVTDPAQGSACLTVIETMVEPETVPLHVPEDPLLEVHVPVTAPLTLVRIRDKVALKFLEFCVPVSVPFQVPLKRSGEFAFGDGAVPHPALAQSRSIIRTMRRYLISHFAFFLESFP